MSSLQAFVRLGVRRWTRMLPPLRNSVDTSPKATTASLPDCPTNCHFSSDNSSKTYQLSKSGAVQSVSLLKKEDGPSEDENNISATRADAADQLIAYSHKIYANTFAKSCEYLLTDWVRAVKQLQNVGSTVDLKRIVSGKLPEIVEFVLTLSAPIDLRHKCLILLLSEATDQKLTSRILEQTIKDAVHLPLKVLADITSTLSTASYTPLRQNTRIQLLTVIINQRWFEIPPKYLVFFMYQMDELFDMKKVSKQQRQKERHEKPNLTLEAKLSNLFDGAKEGDGGLEQDTESSTLPQNSTSIMSINVEARATRLASDLKVKDLARVVNLLAKWRNRNETLLNTIVHFLSLADLSDFSFVQLNNLLFSFSVLHFRHEEILGKIAAHLAQLAPTSPALACASLASLSHLRWNDTVLISKNLHFLADHISDLTVKDAQSVLMSLANLYAVPTNEAESNLVLNLASRVFSGNVSPTDKINCAWCLAIIISLGAEFGESLLQPEFVNEILGDKDADDFQKQASLQKLNSINIACQYEVRDYSGPLLSDEILKDGTLEAAVCSDKALHSEFVTTLKTFVDLKTYASFEDGLLFDAVMCANSSGEVCPLKQTEKDNGKVYKLAIQLIPFSGMLSLGDTPVGSYCMAARHLKHIGYVPVQVPYFDLKSSKSVLEKVNNIKANIKSRVLEVSAAK